MKSYMINTNSKLIRVEHVAKTLASRAWLLPAVACAALLCLLAGNNLISAAASSDSPEVANRTFTSMPAKDSGISTSRAVKPPMLYPLVQAPPPGPSIQTCADAACGTPQSSFNVGDTVYIKISGISVGGFFPRFVLWGAPDSTIVQSAAVTTDPQNGSLLITSTFTINGRTIDSRGLWQVVILNPFFFFPEATARFTVVDAANPTADIGVASTSVSSSAQVGSNVVFGLQVNNYGPDSSANVQLTDAVPNNTTFVSFSQTSGPAFTCSTNTGLTTCSIASLAAGGVAAFVATYQVNGGTEITNAANISSDTPDQNSLDNSTTATVPVTGGGGGGGTCTLSCPEDISTSANTTENNQRGAHVTFDAAQTSDPDICGAVTATPASGSFFPVGTTVVNVTSASGGGACSFTVTVNDSGTNPPTISCPANVTANADNNCAAVVTLGTPTVTGNNVTIVGVRSDGQPMYNCDCFPNSPDQADDSCNIFGGCSRKNPDLPFSSGVTTVTWQAISHSTPGPYQTPADEEAARTGTASCRQTVTVNDVTPPVITATDQTVSADANCQAAVPDYTNAVTDNCACAANDTSQDCVGQHRIALTQNPAAGTLVGLGPHTIHLTANDGSSNNNGAGNTTTKDITLTVVDTTPPMITCPANITTNTDPGLCSAVVNPGTATATDNCDSNPTVVGTRSDNQPLNAPYPKGTTTITWTATDHASPANQSSCQQTVTVQDHEPPTISCPSNITLESTCPSGAIATYTTPVGMDNCPGAVTTRTAGLASGSVFPIGTTTVTYSVTDASGNGPVSCSFTVTVLTPQQVIQNMINAVNANSSLNGSQKQGLVAKLQAALDAINQGKTNVACNKLADFNSQVSAYISNGTLTSAQGQPLINSSNHVRNTIGCTNNPCT